MQDPDSYYLAEILAALRIPATMATFDVVARDLSRLAGRKIPWTKKYIHSVYHGRMQASPELKRAIESLAQYVDGTPAGVAGAVWVKVLARPGLREGALVPAGAQVVKCARPGCPVWFIKTHPRQLYHDPECRGKS